MTTPDDRLAQPFGKQSGGQHRKTIGKFVDAFEAAGNDISGLLSYFLEHSRLVEKNQVEVKQNIREALREAAAETDKTLDQLLEAIKVLHSAKTTTDRERLRIMSILAPILTRADLIRRGFRVSNDAFANARKHASSPGPGAPVNVGGRPRLYTPELGVVLNQFCCRPDIAYANPTYIAARQSLTEDQMRLLENEEHFEVHDQFGNPVPIPLRAVVLDTSGKEIPNRVLRVSIPTLWQRFKAEFPQHAAITQQGLRSMLPKSISRKPQEGNEDVDEMDANNNPTETQKRKRSRSKATAGPDSATSSSAPSHLAIDPSTGAITMELADEHVPSSDMAEDTMGAAHELHPDLSSMHPEDHGIIHPEDGAPPRKRAKDKK